MTIQLQHVLLIVIWITTWGMCHPILFSEVQTFTEKNQVIWDAVIAGLTINVTESHSNWALNNRSHISAFYTQHY